MPFLVAQGQAALRQLEREREMEAEDPDRQYLEDDEEQDERLQTSGKGRARGRGRGCGRGGKGKGGKGKGGKAGRGKGSKGRGKSGKDHDGSVDVQSNEPIDLDQPDSTNALGSQSTNKQAKANTAVENNDEVNAPMDESTKGLARSPCKHASPIKTTPSKTPSKKSPMLHRTQRRRYLLKRSLSSPKVKSGEQQGDGESSKVDTNNEGKQSTKRKDVNTGKGGAGNGEAKAKARRKETVKNDEERCDEGEENKNPAGSAPKKSRTAEIDPKVLEQACCTCCRGNGCHVWRFYACACMFSFLIPPVKTCWLDFLIYIKLSLLSKCTRLAGYLSRACECKIGLLHYQSVMWVCVFAFVMMGYVDMLR